MENVTNHPARDTSVSWSPAGHKLVFISDGDGQADIFVMHISKTNARRWE
ncbi:PD40 domain-containing protein [Sulfidibacter corallicola]|uniref:PD40 domain-containing protein n=1 Tax=Sulfidibacter corallicola TaxID=2818388 RepID=A0A8A4TIN7_SULCO|nr:PD40 domain-containing protein [Sulfidibacter corallicola]